MKKWQAISKEERLFVVLCVVCLTSIIWSTRNDAVEKQRKHRIALFLTRKLKRGDLISCAATVISERPEQDIKTGSASLEFDQVQWFDDAKHEEILVYALNGHITLVFPWG